MKLSIHEYGMGQSPTIVFLHGLGVSSWMWADQVKELAQDYHILAIDLPGSGDSYELPWLSFSDTADQLAGVIKNQASSGQGHIVGLSLGGYTALHLLNQHPQVVSSMIISGVTVKPLVPALIAKPMAALMPLLVKRKMMANMMVRMMELPADAAELYYRDIDRLTPENIKQIYREVFSFYTPAIAAPEAACLLAVAGENEAKAVLAGLEEMAARFPTITTAVVPKAHHGWNAQLPDLFNHMIQTWISGSSLPNEFIQTHANQLQRVPPQVM